MRRFGAADRRLHDPTVGGRRRDGAHRIRARLPELAIEGPETLDRLFDAMFGEQPEGVRRRIRRKYANKKRWPRRGSASR